MKRLPPQHLKPKYYEPVEAQLERLFYDLLFRPLVKVADEATDQMRDSAHGMLNASANPLQSALRSGKIQYAAGVFSGQFSAATSGILKAIGARWDTRSKVWKIDDTQAPGWVKAEAAAYMQTAQGAHRMMQLRLNEIEQQLDSLLDKKPISAKQTLHAIQSDFRDIAQMIEVMPTLTADSEARLAADYSNNMKLYVKNFSKEMITSLRGVVEQSATEGYRFDKLIAGIQRRYGVTQNKAKFLARQETGLFMSKYRRERFSEAGVTHYKWSTSHDERVRPVAGQKVRTNNHRVLDGRMFAYADPPVVDTATGRRANPGEDFNCRCVDIPILEPVGAV